jgi:hypothetical protein
MLPGIANVKGKETRDGVQGRKNTGLVHAYVQC